MKINRDRPFLFLPVALMVTACSGGGGDAGSGGQVTGPFEPDTSLLTRVSPASPFAPGCDAATERGTSYLNAEVEPLVAINPANPQELYGAWQQDRWSDFGGSHGLNGARSADGGMTWTPSRAPFSRCAGGTLANGGDYERASDPWVSFGADGHLYAMSLSFTGGDNAMLVSRSLDGGQNWEAPRALITDDANFLDDKNSLTADPTDANFVYAIWDRLDFRVSYDLGPSYFARSTDGGASWEAARAIYDPGPQRQTIGNEIAVLPDGTLLASFAELFFSANGSQPDTATARILRSTDHGATWSAPVTVAPMFPVGVRDPRTGTAVRDAAVLPRIAVSPGGHAFVVWQDSRFSSGVREGIAMATSVDGGLSWSAPVQVNRMPSVPAFIPSIAVAGDGTIGVSYADTREADSRPYFLASYWLATSADGVSWSERKLSGPFDLAMSPLVLGRLFAGDYQGLVAGAASFRAFFSQTNATVANPTDIYTRSLPSVISAGAKSLLSYRAIAAPPGRLDPEALWRVSERVRLERHRPPARGVARED